MGTMAAQNILDYFAGRLDPALIVNGADLARELAADATFWTRNR